MPEKVKIEIDYSTSDKIEVEAKKKESEEIDDKIKDIFNIISEIQPVEYNSEGKPKKEFFKISDDNPYTFKNIQISQNKNYLKEIDHEIIQFGSDGFKFWVDYSNSKEDNPKKIQFLRQIVIPQALGRISSFSKPKKRIKLGPFSNKAIKKCNKKFIKVSKFYTRHSIGNIYFSKF